MTEKTLDRNSSENLTMNSEGTVEAGASTTDGVRPARANPARKVALIVITVMVALVTWYTVSDRLTPYSSRGSVSAYVALIAPRVSGQITEVYAQDNVVVNAGEPLFQIDDRPFRIAVRQAEANLAQATQSIDASSASLVASQASVAQGTHPA